VKRGLAAALVSCLAACGPSLTPAAGVTPEGTIASVASGPRISPPPVSPPSPPNVSLPPFVCADAKGGKTGAANVITARTSRQDGYDRFVLQFDGIVPSYTVTRQARPVFTKAGSSESITLSGTAGILVNASSATGVTTFTGSQDLVHNDFPVLKEARQIQDFGGTVSWGLGLSKPTCMRVFTLTGPARLVVDLQTPSS
jgi:hypothetical protein